MASSYLGLEALSVLVTNGGNSIGIKLVQEFLHHGCSVAVQDSSPIDRSAFGDGSNAAVHSVQGNITEESSVRSCIDTAQQAIGPIHVLVVNVGLQDESRNDAPSWLASLDRWQRGCRAMVDKMFPVIRYFLQATARKQNSIGRILEPLAIIVVGDTGDIPLHNLVGQLQDNILKLNPRARVNAVEWTARSVSPDNTTTLDQLQDLDRVARTTAFLASDRAAGLLTGQCLSVGCRKDTASNTGHAERSAASGSASTPRSLGIPTTPRVRIALTIDFDAVSGWLGTGAHPDNTLADYSAGFFAANVGVPRILRLLRKLGIADRCTWFIPGHSAESFEDQAKQIVDSGCEIGLHGYAHEGAYQLTPEQERDVLDRCIKVSTKLTGKKPVGYRAPLYQVRETTLDLLEERGLEYDASLTDHDCRPFFAPRRPPLHRPDFGKPASSWMHPIPSNDDGTHHDRRPLVEIPCNWYMEDMTPMQFLPHVPNSHGFVDVREIEQKWKDRFMWIWENEETALFPLVLHPDTSGMAHVIGMIERMLRWLQSWGPGVEFCQACEIARQFRREQLGA